MFSQINMRIVRNFSAIIIAQVINKLFPVFVYAYAQAKLTTTGFGYALFAIALVDWTSPIIDAGSSQLGQIKIGRHKLDKTYVGSLLGEVLSMKMLNAVIAAVGLSIVTITIYPQYWPAVVAISFMLLATVIDMTYVQTGTQKVWALSVFNIVSKMIVLAGIFLWIKDPGDQVIFAVLMVATNSLYSIVTYWAATREFKIRRPKFGAVVKLYRTTAPFALTVLLFYSLEKFDLLLVEHFLGPEAVGIYGGTARLIASLQAVIPALILAFGSEMLSSTSDEGFSRQLTLSLGFAFLFVVPVAFGSIFVAPDLLTLIYNQTFLNGVPVFILLSFSLIPQAILFTCGFNALTPKGHVASVNIAMIWGLAAGLISAFLLLRYVEDFAAIAGAVLISKLVMSTLLIGKSRQYITKGAVKIVLRIFLAAILMGAVLQTLTSFQPEANLVLKLALGGGVFVVSTLCFNFDFIRRLRHKI